MFDGECGAGGHLMSFDLPILVIGDAFQLPPVKGAGYFIDAEPDAMLTEAPGSGTWSPPPVQRVAA